MVADKSWHVGTVRLRGKRANAYSDFFSYEALRIRNIGGKVFLPSAVFAIRQDLFWAVGGFEESFPDAAGEDWDLLQKLHAREPLLSVVCHVDIVAEHENPETLLALLRRAFRYGLHAHRYLKSSPLSRTPLRERVAELIFCELLVPLNRGLTDLENFLRGSVLPQHVRPLTSLKIAAIRAQRRIRNSVEPLSEGRQRFLLMERLWFRVRNARMVESYVPTLGSAENDLAYVKTYNRGITKTVDIPLERNLADTSFGQHSFFIRIGLVTIWSFTHRFAVLLGVVWSKLYSSSAALGFFGGEARAS